jgi:hypothetical protein
MMSEADTAPELVLLIHGTYAGRETSLGSSWWQLGSSTCEGLKQRLPHGVQLPQEPDVFHWSGENSERARIHAAQRLLTRLQRWEAQGRYYHLIGHSHGGSVIWHCLRLAASSRTPLRHLRSWATVGTPFLHQKTEGSARVAHILRTILGLILIKPAYTTAIKFYDLVFRPGKSVWLGNDGAAPEHFTLYETPVLRLLELLQVPIQRTPEGILIGGEGAIGVHTGMDFVLTSPIGWLMIGLALIVIYAYLNLTLFFLRPVIESWQLWDESRVEKKAHDLFASRWLGLWSPDDEAINGLRATLDLSITFVARMTPRERVLFSDYVTLLSQPSFWIAAPIYNSFLRPFLDNVVRTLVVKAAQGNNRPGAQVVEVSPIPWRMTAEEQPYPLPGWLNEQLVQNANAWAQDVVPKLRTALAAPSFVSGLEAWGKSSSGRELIHTSYFDHPAILDLLTMHIAGSIPLAHWSEFAIFPNKQGLIDWLIEAKTRVSPPHPEGRSFGRASPGHPSTSRMRPRKRSLLRPAA